MKAKLVGFVDPKQAVIKYPESDQSDPGALCARLCLSPRRLPRQGQSEADALLATNPHDPYFLELKGQILLEGGKPTEAIAPLREATQRPAMRR